MPSTTCCQHSISEMPWLALSPDRRHQSPQMGPRGRGQRKWENKPSSSFASLPISIMDTLSVPLRLWYELIFSQVTMENLRLVNRKSPHPPFLSQDTCCHAPSLPMQSLSLSPQGGCLLFPFPSGIFPGLPCTASAWSLQEPLFPTLCLLTLSLEVVLGLENP